MEEIHISSNYQWWQANGQSWPDEVRHRKQFMPIYHIQEVFLAEYFGRNAPASVLEFGCGFGRHLSYLTRIPGLEVAGCDQSQSMIDGMHEWASGEWIAKHIQLNEPLAPLPYPDNSFDIVFTVSVLIHVRPEHVSFILQELLRVCKWQIIHIENNTTPDTIVTADAHDGCWAHPIAQYYEALGHRTEILGKPFEIEDVYRVIVDNERPIADMSNVTLSKLLTLDRATVNYIRSLEEHTPALTHQIMMLNDRINKAEIEKQRLSDVHTQKLQQLWAENARLISERNALSEQVHAMAETTEQWQQRYTEMESTCIKLEESLQKNRMMLNNISLLLISYINF